MSKKTQAQKKQMAKIPFKQIGGFGPLFYMEAYQKLQKIFNGLTRAHGVFYKGETKESGKVGGKAYIIKEEVTEKHWRDHVEGVDPSLGIIPILIVTGKHRVPSLDH